MSKTASQIERDFYHLFKPTLEGLIGGQVYRGGMRPALSSAEDAVVRFHSCLSGQIQRGKAHINVYVPDMMVAKGGYIRDGERCDFLEIALKEMVENTRVGSYWFWLSQAVETLREPALNQHFVHLKLDFKLDNLDDY